MYGVNWWQKYTDIIYTNMMHRCKISVEVLHVHVAIGMEKLSNIVCEYAMNTHDHFCVLSDVSRSENS